MASGIRDVVRKDWAFQLSVGREHVDIPDSAAHVLRGETPPSARVPSFATAVRRFDARQLARWHLDERRLPEDSQSIFREPTLWQQYRWHVLGAVGLMAAQAALIVMLLVQRRRRRQAQEALAEGLRFETLVSEIIAACATATLDQLDERIRDGLRRVVMFLGVDRGSLWQRSDDRAPVSRTHFWQKQDQPAPGVATGLQSFPYF